MKNTNKFLLSVISVAVAAGTMQASAELKYPINFPAPKEGQYVHVPPTMQDLEEAKLHPELKRVIRRGHDLFMNTQQLRGKNVFNSMNCSSCHMGEGRLPFASPVWSAAVILPNYRPKNNHVNSLEERIAGCFSYSMNGKPPEYGSDDMVALSAYHQWLAKGVPIYQPGNSMYGRGYPRLPEPAQKVDYKRGQKVYQEQCQICHGSDGAGLAENGNEIFPALWGDRSYNWGAGISRNFTLAAFVKYNMPLGQPNKLTEQQAWDVAYYINSHERPQDPRFEGDVKKTRAMYDKSFHKDTHYGLVIEGKLMGDHMNLGEKDFLMPDVLRPRTFTAD